MMSERKKLIWLGALIVVAVLVWTVQRVKPSAGGGGYANFSDIHLLAVENPRLHHEKMEAAQGTEYKSSGRNIFTEIAQPPPDQTKTPDNTATGPTGPPPVQEPPKPQLPAKYFGYGTIPNGTARRAFLTNGDDVYIVGEGDTLLGRFRIVKISSGNIEFEEISSGRRNTAPLEEQSAGPAT